MKKLKTEQELINITLRINEIRLLHFELAQRVQHFKSSPSLDSYEFRFDVKTEIIQEQSLFSNILDVTIYEKDENIKIELAKLSTLTSFFIVNFEEIFRKVDDKLKAPSQLFAMTAGIAISSARGILCMNLKDSIISNAIIPIVNPQDFIPKSVQ